MRISDWSSDVCSSDLAGVRGAREHAIFRRHPALALAAQPRRKLSFDRGGAEHARVAEADEATSLGMTGEAGFHGDRPHLVGRASGWAHDFPFDGSAGHLASPPSSFQRKLESIRSAERRGGKECVRTGKY